MCPTPVYNNINRESSGSLYIRQIRRIFGMRGCTLCCCYETQKCHIRCDGIGTKVGNDKKLMVSCERHSVFLPKNPHIAQYAPFNC